MVRLVIAIACIAASTIVMADDFAGYPCTQDCSGHEAGFDWAERKSIDDVDDCGGNSESFIEGCHAYVEENKPAEDASEPVDGSEPIEE